MIVVMTMNVGYFFAVIGGIFFGELGFGRFIASSHVVSPLDGQVKRTKSEQSSVHEDKD